MLIEHLPAAVLIDQADAALGAGLQLAAGCLIRAAIEVHLTAVCRHHDSTAFVRTGRRAKLRPRPIRLLVAARRWKLLGGIHSRSIAKALNWTNAAAHGEPVTFEGIRAAREIAVAFIAATPTPAESEGALKRNIRHHVVAFRVDPRTGDGVRAEIMSSHKMIESAVRGQIKADDDFAELGTEEYTAAIVISTRAVRRKEACQ